MRELTQEELDLIRQCVVAKRAVSWALVQRLLDDRDRWITRAYSAPNAT